MRKKQTCTIELVSFSARMLEDFWEWASDEKVTATLRWDCYKTKEEAFEFLKEYAEPHPWFKAIQLEGKAIGSITLDQGKGCFSHKAELGLVIARNYWGIGLATEAVKKAVGTGFDELGIHRIEAYADPQNLASQRVLEKGGFTREALLKEWTLHKGSVRDRWLFARSRHGS